MSNVWSRERNRYFWIKDFHFINILFVFKGHSIETNEQVAIKVIDKTRFSDQEEKIHREVDILHEITHPGVIKLHAMFDTPGKVI